MNVNFINDSVFIITITTSNNVKTYQGKIDTFLQDQDKKQIYKLINTNKYNYVEYGDKIVIKMALNYNDDYYTYSITCTPIYKYIANENEINNLVQETNPIIKSYILDLKNRIKELEYGLENSKTEITYLNNKLDNLYEDIWESNLKKKDCELQDNNDYCEYDSF